MKRKAKIEEMEEELITLRREFHQIPEVGLEEKKTSRKIAAYLKNLGLKVKEGVGQTGVVGLLKGAHDGATVGIRADIDALPITEQTGLPFSSKHEGCMHACGHDGHITIALGTAKFLTQIKDKIHGNVKFIFQPAEETLAGARAMINDDVLSDPDLSAIFGLHIWPELESGMIGLKPGPIMAAVDKFSVTIKGKGGHGAIPQKAVDPVVIAVDVVNGFQKIISREVDPLQSGVITVGKFNGGTAFNIIPDEVKMEGTVRTFIPQVRELIPRRMEAIATGITSGGRGKCKFDYQFGVPATDNAPWLVEKIISQLEQCLGSEKVIQDVRPSMGGEDFALYQQEIPGVYMFLGTRNEARGIIHSIHHPQYTFDEEILKIGVRSFVEIVFAYLA